jgi:hypothetical protein
MAEIRPAEIAGDFGNEAALVKARVMLAPGALCERPFRIVPRPKNMLRLLNPLLFLGGGVVLSAKSPPRGVSRRK